MSAELLAVLRKLVDDVNSDFIVKKRLPSDAVVAEVRVTGKGSVFVEVSEKGVKTLDRFDDIPNCVITGGEEELMKLLKGELDPVKAFFFGKIRVERGVDIAYMLYERFREHRKMLSPRRMS